MLKNYFKTALRNLTKNKAYAAINITGLSAGMAVAMLIGLWVWDEFSYNKYFDNYNSITQLEVNADYDGTVYTVDSHPIPLGTTLRSSYAGDFKYVVMSSGTEQHSITVGDRQFKQAGRYMQPEAPAMLTLEMIKGTRDGLADPNSIMLAKATAKKLFGDEDAVGKVVEIDSKLAVKVTGVYDDMPANTAFSDVTFIAPFELYVSSNDWVKKAQDNWLNQSVQIFTQMAPNADVAKVSAKIKSLKLQHVSGAQAARKPALFLSPMNQWHLYSNFKNGVTETSAQLKFIWFYSTIGAFVLLLACINFMNMSTARSEKRAKEVGIRKAIGSLRSQLISQFFCESWLVAACSFMLAVALVQLSLPWFNGIANKSMSVPFTNPVFWMAAMVFITFTGLLAGSYPAFYLSSFRPVKVLKGAFRTGRLAAVPRKVLVVLQFTICTALIIGTIVVYQQVQFAKGRAVGYTRDGLVSISLTPGLQDKYNVLRSELKSTGTVAEVAESASPLTSIWSTNSGFVWKNKPVAMQDEFATISVTHEYGKTVGWQFTGGRDFSRMFASDSAGYVINEAAVKYMGLKNPVGEAIHYNGKDYLVLGVVKDMVMESPFQSAFPTIFSLGTDQPNCMFIKINPGVSASAALDKIKAVLKKVSPTSPVDYAFVDEEYAAKFAAEERIGTLAGFFAALSIFISCLGLFGMASFMAEQRTKEIGVRKVLGASIFNLWGLMSREFVVLVTISLLIAAPVAYYAMHNWLQNYQYRTNISWWVFAATAAGAMVITLATVSYQSIKAAIANPVKSLRTE